MSTELDFCNCRRPDPVVVDDLSTCMACGALFQGKVSDAEATHGMEWLTSDELSNPHHIPAYKHARLDRDKGKKSVRLINLSHGSYDDPVQCSIHHADLADNPHFEAVSYTWADEKGDCALSSTIYCSRAALRVTKSCESVLRRLRHPIKNHWIWVDAVAIDQGDISERNHQVALMKEIYSHAHRVLIYAGEASFGSDRLLSYLGARGPSKPGDIDVFRLFSHADGLKKELESLLARPWFKRTWVVQEAYLAARATFIVGEMSLDWTLLQKPRLKGRGLFPLPNMKMLPGVLEWMDRQWAKDIDLLFALTTTRTCLATDPRDKVFAVLGLLDVPAGFEADYNLTHKEVLTLTAADLITSLNSLAVLCYAEETPSRSSIPSWVPSWSSDSGVPLKAQFAAPGKWTSQRLWHYDPELLELSPTTSYEPLCTPLIDLRLAMTLVAEGIQLDEAQHLFDHEYTESNSLPRRTSSHECHDKQLLFTYVVGKEYGHRNFTHCSYPVLFRSRDKCTCRGCAGRASGSAPRSDRSGFPMRPINDWNAIEFSFNSYYGIHRYNRYEKTPSIDWFLGDTYSRSDSVLSGGGDPSPEQELECCKPRSPKCGPIGEAFERKEFDAFIKQTKSLRTSRMGFETDITLGFGPRNLQPGDTIWRLQGAAVPIVLRAVGKQYQVIGECYLHGAGRFHDTDSDGDQLVRRRITLQ
jgi:hypothetical protein